MNKRGQAQRPERSPEVTIYAVHRNMMTGELSLVSCPALDTGANWRPIYDLVDGDVERGKAREALHLRKLIGKNEAFTSPDKAFEDYGERVDSAIRNAEHQVAIWTARAQALQKLQGKTE